jgi:hypothetical protein
MSLYEAPAPARRRPYIEALGRLELWQPLRRREMFLAHAWGVRVGGVTYRVPAGMDTDGASIPRVFWRLIDPPMYSRLFPGAIIHDAAYGGILRAGNEAEGTDWLPVERDEADELLRLIGVWNQFPAWKAEAAWRAVHYFGQAAWESGHALNEGLDLRTLDYAIPQAPGLN